MIKKILNVIKKIILAVLLIYIYNTMTLPLDLFIPMNIFTILLVSVCGIPSVIMLILFSLVCI